MKGASGLTAKAKAKASKPGDGWQPKSLLESSWHMFYLVPVYIRRIVWLVFVDMVVGGDASLLKSLQDYCT